jgi:glycosyltransferase involved in cell wall biosynthesis
MRIRGIIPLLVILDMPLFLLSLYFRFLAYFAVVYTLLLFFLLLMVTIYYYQRGSYRASDLPLSYKIERINICVAIPAYNEEESIYDVVKDFKSIPFVSKVIVVDNNSYDNTAKLAQKAGAIVIKEYRQGYGHASIRGLKECLINDNANVIALVEGDSTFRALDLYKMLPYLEHADMVLGTRTVPLLIEKRSQLDYFYYLGNIFLAILITLKYIDKHIKISDVGCTFRIIRRDALERIIDKLKEGGNAFSPHMIMVALENSLNIIEVPITFWKRRGKSKGASANKWKGIKTGLEMLKIIIFE